MSIPLDRLYTHLNNLCNHDDIVISRWYPHGSKNAGDLKLLRDWGESVSPLDQLGVICHDQEPLQFDFYTVDHLIDTMRHKFHFTDESATNDPKFQKLIETMHLRSVIEQPLNQYDQTILVHSELASSEVDRYRQQDFIPVYWWAHGAIAQDWFRYARSDLELRYPKTFNKTFLVYARAWTGSRQYRLEFLQDIKSQQLHKDAVINFSAWDQGQHFSTVVDDHDLDSCFAKNTAPSSASADYSSEDYKNCAIELVLETIYETSRIHLTEKTCRPLACGKPFILAAGPGSLQTLKRYGFKTFSPLIDESYDLETDLDTRRSMIIKEIARLSALPKSSPVWEELHNIAAENKQRFFSEEFTSQVFAEFVTNFDAAYSQLTSTGKYAKMFYNYAKNNVDGQSLYVKASGVFALYQQLRPNLLEESAF